ncbi:MAG TPA: AAA family ATPase [Acidimicrobiales bacterium]|nr:AAA family ATPase [Acidimicrobiales bacterium]
MLTADKVATTATAPHPEVIALRLPPLVLGSTTAKAVHACWSGEPATLVDSPPGAGKTTLTATVAAHLAARGRLAVAIACNTNAQAFDLANRLGAMNPKCEIRLFGRYKSRRPEGLNSGVEFATNAKKLDVGVNIGTASRWEWVHPSVFTADLLAIDEAYQCSFSTFGALTPIAKTYLLVGDPGQIAPVVTGNTQPWDHNPTGPHLPAPQAFLAAAGDAITTLTLPHTYRLGPASTALVQPAFYPSMPFTSARPNRALLLGGVAAPEIDAYTVTGAGHECDPAVLDTAAARVRGILHGGLIEDENGTRPVAQSDIAVVCSRVSQTAGIRARLADLDDVLVDTANSVQGLERDVVVALDPLIGAGTSELSDFAIDPGRACVLLSRHRSHLSFITRSDVSAILAADETNRDGIRAHRHVRRSLGLEAA